MGADAIASTEFIIKHATGNVGIAVTNPTSKLQVAPAYGVRRPESPLSVTRQRRPGPAHSMRFATALALLLLATFLHQPSTAYAQQYALPWFKIAGGGATAPSTGGEYALSGTIGQIDAGRVASTNDSYRLEAGFWAIAIQQLGYPSLNITQSGTNAVISWVTVETGLLLQETTTLATPTAWSDTVYVPLVSGPSNLVTVPLNPAARQFFRLRRP